MSEQPLLWLIPGLPLAAAVFVALFGPGGLKRQSHWPVVFAAAASFLVSLITLGPIFADKGVDRIVSPPVTWFAAGGVSVSYQLAADPLTAVMLIAITFIGTWIAVFSIGYMYGDPAYPRYFAVFSAFLFAMCGLVLADNLLLLYAFWEGVGLCSYLLIGFWFARPSAAKAARKAFLVTRIGDAGLILGIFLLWVNCGYKLDYAGVFAAGRDLDPTLLTTCCLLLFVGCVGKSAQFPLHVWLPDAMEGPTPASALIHAATMVTAGVYLVARCMPLFALSLTAQMTVAGIGAFTALLAALIALTQDDLKRVLAYSTVSQLGFMFLALGSGVGDLAVFGATAAIFHLFTHAFFKALLFLAAGSVMHAMGHVIDMRRIGGLKSVLPWTHATFLLGALALAGIPMLSGFFSKDEILLATLSAAYSPLSEAGKNFYAMLLVVGLVTAFLTAFYTFRAYFLTFWGDVLIPPEAGHHGHDEHHGHDPHHASEPGTNHQPHGQEPGVAHESPAVMLVPLVVLAVGAVIVGGLLVIDHRLEKFLARVPYFVKHLPHHHGEPNLGLMLLSSLIAVSGAALAWTFYVDAPQRSAQAARLFGPFTELSRRRFYFDEIYGWLVVGPLGLFAEVCKVIDMILDQFVDLIGGLPKLAGGWFRPIQNGMVQWYALTGVFFLVAVMAVFALAR